ncbi:MAG: hypothetical protein DPW21_12125 [Anaerolineae bacterium]|nr:hypothetical protein [Anaerolineae bacterium]RIK26734.1 MAG: hypothetical protein DCC54_05700 [Anaerolineae bacterium]WKZ50293.1 MAG: hypothetical protein QY329_12605 [Anaerolineales bacterium]
MTLVEEEYLDVLQNIEWAILSVYRENPQLFDYDVDKALNALWMGYRSEQIGKAKPPPAFNELQDLLYERVRAICEWRLGRNPVQKEGEDGEVVDLSPEPLTHDVILACIKRIRKSVEFWTKEGGRQGYLYFIDRNSGL